MSKRWWCGWRRGAVRGRPAREWPTDRVREVEDWEVRRSVGEEWRRRRGRQLGKGVRVVKTWEAGVDRWLDECHGERERRRNQGNGGWRRRRGAGLLVLEAKLTKWSGGRGKELGCWCWCWCWRRKIKMETAENWNGKWEKGKCKIGYLYLGFIRVF